MCGTSNFEKRSVTVVCGTCGYVGDSVVKINPEPADIMDIVGFGDNRTITRGEADCREHTCPICNESELNGDVTLKVDWDGKLYIQGDRRSIGKKGTRLLRTNFKNRVVEKGYNWYKLYLYLDKRNKTYDKTLKFLDLRAKEAERRMTLDKINLDDVMDNASNWIEKANEYVSSGKELGPIAKEKKVKLEVTLSLVEGIRNMVDVSYINEDAWIRMTSGGITIVRDTGVIPKDYLSEHETRKIVDSMYWARKAETKEDLDYRLRYVDGCLKNLVHWSSVSTYIDETGTKHVVTKKGNRFTDNGVVYEKPEISDWSTSSREVKEQYTTFKNYRFENIARKKAGVLTEIGKERIKNVRKWIWQNRDMLLNDPEFDAEKLSIRDPNGNRWYWDRDNKCYTRVQTICDILDDASTNTDTFKTREEAKEWILRNPELVARFSMVTEESIDLSMSGIDPSWETVVYRNSEEETEEMESLVEDEPFIEEEPEIIEEEIEYEDQEEVE
jgi:hypothetical protein